MREPDLERDPPPEPDWLLPRLVLRCGVLGGGLAALALALGQVREAGAALLGVAAALGPACLLEHLAARRGRTLAAGLALGALALPAVYLALAAADLLTQGAFAPAEPAGVRLSLLLVATPVALALQVRVLWRWLRRRLALLPPLLLLALVGSRLEGAASSLAIACLAGCPGLLLYYAALDVLIAEAQGARA
ncbi:MAG: hypothetical protein AB7N76_15585 [Planctomycetota bacterium]